MDFRGKVDSITFDPDEDLLGVFEENDLFDGIL